MEIKFIELIYCQAKVFIADISFFMGLILNL